ncbi:MAG: homocysteine S-methyltransferase family protein [Planktomarina sp.]
MIILDGGLGQELVKRSGRATGLWSTQALLDAPELVRAVHDDYFAAGADVVTTDTYSVLPDRLESHNIGDALERLAQVACQLCVDARDAHGAGRVAGSLGPLGFSYQPDLAPPAARAAEIYAMLAQLHAPYVDLHILETMASIDQAKGGLMGASITGKPVWVSLSVDDTDGTKLRSGEALVDILPVLEEFAPQVVSINCSKPEAVSAGLPTLVGHGWQVGAYANGFTSIDAGFNKIGVTVDMLSARKDLGPAEYLEFAKVWAASGADVIGGCCEVGPDHIRMLAEHFADAD